ncbi:MAG TPA: metal-dependent hydrolase [Gammaproteobacteria bacterium]|nr:metal-dependent hydrolase [Gammaproteobacteria bacterium]
MLRRLFFALTAVLALSTPAMVFGAGHTNLTWYGHAAFKIVTPQGHVVLVDPWITNPSNPKGKEDLAAIDKADLILVSHGHSDHVGDAVDIAKRTGAHLVTNFDLGMAMVADLGFPAAQAGYDTLGNAGGTLSLLGGEVRITFEPAVHGSAVYPAAPQGQPQPVQGAGDPGGFVIRIKDGPTFYHTGDTNVFGDMKLIGDADKVTVMLACIGDHFTMGPTGAAQAVQLVRPEIVIPMHYGTFPVLTGTPEDFARALKAKGLGTQLKVMKVGETASF